jgi:hypothetical protein
VKQIGGVLQKLAFCPQLLIISNIDCTQKELHKILSWLGQKVGGTVLQQAVPNETSLPIGGSRFLESRENGRYARRAPSLPSFLVLVSLFPVSCHGAAHLLTAVVWSHTHAHVEKRLLV